MSNFCRGGFVAAFFLANWVKKDHDKLEEENIAAIRGKIRC